ncbi:MutS-related protein [Empedobacter sedimenti]|uniref:MutS-related protein n=1 Tax=Empedobacter sedimenti TaxID=3042610 RepID=UPI0024A713FB|nr:hypothetical protein [Empedobacter sedimenti]
MLNIENLNLKKDILPFFDATLNQHTQFHLIDFLNTKPKNLNEVLYNQSVIKTFINQLPTKEHYYYSKTTYNEVYQKIQNLETVYYLDIAFFSGAKTALKSTIIQIYTFLFKISDYINSFDITLFPHKFTELLQNLKEILEILNVSDFLHLKKKGKLNLKKIIEYNQLLIDQKSELFLFFKNLNIFEVYLSISLKTLNSTFTFPEISNQNEFELSEFYYPLLKNPIKNDFKTTKNVIVLTGANMSGKSTFFRAIAFCSFLGNLGLPIPATQAKIPFYKSISINIDHTDNVLKGYSHFMNEIVNLKNYVLEVKNDSSGFAIFDELFSGTNSVDANNLLRKTIKGLNSFDNTLTFISTHLNETHNELNQLEAVDFIHLDCIIENDLPLYTYKIKKGWSNIKVGQLIFRNEGLDELLES